MSDDIDYVLANPEDYFTITADTFFKKEFNPDSISYIAATIALGILTAVYCLVVVPILSILGILSIFNPFGLCYCTSIIKGIIGVWEFAGWMIKQTDKLATKARDEFFTDRDLVTRFKRDIQDHITGKRQAVRDEDVNNDDSGDEAPNPK